MKTKQIIKNQMETDNAPDDCSNTNEDEVSAQICKKGIALMNFGANWSSPCCAQRPTINQISEQFDQKLTVKKVDVDDQKKLAMSLHITSIPTSILFKDGKEIKRFVGLQEKSVLSDAILETLD